jgi:Na+-transporting NADH:ubiquinone oxidoreductase subunit A
MVNVIKLKKGLDIKLEGPAVESYFEPEAPTSYALIPDDYTGIVPKLAVKPQDTVKVGDALFVDKNHPEVKFVSPVSGTVNTVERGERRKILAITIDAAAEQEYVDFGKKEVSSITGDDVKELMKASGLFAFVRQRPYDIIADADVQPRAVFISAFDSNPLAPDFSFMLKGDEENFQTGLDALSKIAPVYLGLNVAQSSTSLAEVKNATVNVFDGPHPAGNVGVQINHIAPVNKGETVWTVIPEAVVYLGRLCTTGKIDFTHPVALTGSEVKEPSYCRLKVGAQLTTVFAGRVNEERPLRYISGNVLTGRKIDANGYLGAYSSQLTVIPEGTDVDEPFGWIAPRMNDFSMSHSYFSWLLGKGKKYVMDARVKGGQRHMIMSDEYGKVFPMDIFPEYLIKAIIAGDIDRMEALGIYEVAPEDFALCEFVCSSKMELQRIVREGLDKLREEMC